MNKVMIRNKCNQCDIEFFRPQRAKFCSLKCCWANRRKPNVMENWQQYALEAYEAKHGCKLISRECGISPAAIARFIKGKGLFNPTRQRAARVYPKIYRANSGNKLIMSDYHKEEKAFPDWSKHPEVAKYKWKHNPNRHHYLLVNRRKAKAQYERNKQRSDFKLRRSVTLKRWRKQNPEKVKANVVRLKSLHPQRYKNYRRTVSMRIRNSVRGRFRDKFRNTKNQHRTIDLIGCSISSLRAHLERQFKDGMSWENYGQWHIDHKRPLASFDLHNDNDVKLCCHYSNLQPLWAAENIAKGARWIPPVGILFKS